MRNFIRRWFRRERQISAPEPPPAPEPRIAERPSCRVYVWATAHGIDLRPRSPLGACTCSGQEHQQPLPGIGTFVVDTRDGVVGQVMRNAGPQLLLRTLSGGKEWEAEADAVRPVSEAELLRAKVQAANSASRWGK
ncbi:hypothetical protein [Streptomyces hiroshimensis]|uniref:Uncharacterized protein n=1 Tax=Streptomyces hiroshimensis TaxID=66424 RepID=A0ABQ2Y8T3_9ACTN|nr:hypothetical protein [Streptomyces hiroshimensis]GGX70355.1 hypothetical protein GCM10010324_14250 [Streptomyces hiroshimensis]